MKIISVWRKKSSKFYKWFYIVATVIFSIYYLFQGLSVKKEYSSTGIVQQTVNIHRFELVECDVIDDLTIASSGENCRVVYNGYIDTLYMDCLHTYGLTEHKAYYNTTGDYTFSEEESLKPFTLNNYTVYDFPKGTKQVKLPFPNAKMYFNEIILNCRDHTNAYNLTMDNVFLLLVAPSIVFLSVDLIFSVLYGIAKISKKQNLLDFL